MNPLPILTHENILVNPPKKDFNPYESIAKFLLDAIQKHGKSTAVVHSFTDEKVTYDEIARKTFIIAQALKDRGIKVGDVLGISTENRLEFAPLVLGILAVGATCAPLNPLYNKEELIHILSISRPKMIFCSPFTFNNISELRQNLPFIEEIILLDEKTPSSAEFQSYHDIVKKSYRKENFEFANIDPADTVAFLFCSSGTTGMPKCVELTHVNYMCLLNFSGSMYQKGDDFVASGLIPFFHGYGSASLLTCLLQKVKLILMPRFEEENFLSSISKYKITHLVVVPPLVVFLNKHPMVLKYDLSSVCRITCGAAPLSKETQIAVRKRLKLNTEIEQAYGMTELSIGCVGFQGHPNRIGSSGIIAPGMQCKVVDTETGKALPLNKRGELCFKGYFVMKGYKNNPKATAETFDSKGWFHTGDIAYYDKDGFLYIVDRLKELIKYKGFQVPPAELETILLTHPGVKEAGVIGVPDEEAGELPLAFVVKQPGAKVTEEELKKFVAGKVSPQKRLHGGVRFVNEIPKNPSGKILRRELRSLLNKSKL